MEGAVRWPKEFEAKFRECGFWEDVALGDRLDEWVARYGDNAAIACQGRDISFREMGRQVDLLACHMAETGLRRYDRVILQLFNVPELIYVFYACLKIGAIPVCTLPTHRVAEIGFLARETEAELHVIPGGVVKGFDYDEFAAAMRAESPNLRQILTMGEPCLPDMFSIGRILAGEVDPSALARLAQHRPDASEPAIFQLSGGTTGTPKIIPRTHNDYYYNAKCVARAMEFTETDRVLTPMPMTHNGPIINCLLPIHLAGGCCVLTESFAPQSILRTISAHRATHVGGAVVLMHRMLEVPRESRDQYDLSSLNLLWWSGNIDREDQLKLKAMFHNCDIGQNYGMAEGLICLTRNGDPPEVKALTVGRPVSEADEVRLVDVNTGRDAAVGEIGELWCRGPYTIRGYYKAEERNLEAFTPDGFYKTGDLLRQDADGNLSWVGRIKDCISRGGEKVNAEEVELCISGHPRIKDVAVVAMPDKAMEERICAFVVLHPGETASLDDLTRYLVEQVGIARFKVPERLEILDELPLTKVGKTNKKYLREVITEKLRAEGKM